MWCLTGDRHIWHDNGTRNVPDEEAFLAENAGPTMEGDGYDDRDQEDE